MSGFWHGANWTFVIWGALHGLYFLALFNISNFNSYQKISEKVPSIIKILVTYFLVCFAWVFFRAPDVTVAWDYIIKILSLSTGSDILPLSQIYPALFFIIPFLVIEWISREEEFPFKNIEKFFGTAARKSVYYFFYITNFIL